MALYVLLGLSALFSCVAFARWRWGLLLMILLAAVQDPLRKLVPGAPGWLVLATAPVFLATVVSAIAHTRGWWAGFSRPYPKIARALVLLIPLCAPAAIISLTYGPGSWLFTLFGAFSYSLLFLAVVAGFHYPRDLRMLRRLLAVYCLVNAVMLSGGLLEYLKWFPDWRILGTDALGYTWVRWGSGYTVDMLAGFYRSADVMGWHAAAVCLLSLVLALSGKGARRYGWLLVSAFAVVALLLCGRRKMVYMLPVFALGLLWLYWQAGRAARAATLLVLLMIPLGSVLVVGDWVSEDSANMRYYSGQGLKFDAAESIQGQGFNAVWTTFQQSGFFGGGLGFATPGGHNLAAARPRAWQESAPSRIMFELGVPGTLGFLAVMVSLLLAMLRATLGQLRAHTPQAPYAAGLMAFFLANVGSLTVSGQILADPFIASFLGILVGVVLATPRLPELARRQARPQAALRAQRAAPA